MLKIRWQRLVSKESFQKLQTLSLKFFSAPVRFCCDTQCTKSVLVVCPINSESIALSPGL